MITLITGTPGAGKTALALSMLLQEGENRPLFVSGVKNLAIAHEPLPEVDKWTHSIDAPEVPGGKKVVFDLPPQAVMFVDEAQDVYRPRAASSKVPAYVAALETHRHVGADIWLVTQHPNLLDANVRKLVTRHIHIKRTIAGRKLFEWTDEVGDVESRASRELSARRRYKPPKKVFNLYTSATAHTKVPRRVPVYVYVFVIAVGLCIAAAWHMYGSVTEKLGGKKASDPSHAQGVLGATPGGGAPGTSGQAAPLSWAAAQTPRIPGLPHTAPVYDTVNVVKSAPMPSACVATPVRCTCYTDQATLLHVEEGMCREIVSGGFYEPQREAARDLGAEAPAVDRGASPRDLARPEGARVASIADNFSGSHVGSVESTRVIGRGPTQPLAKPVANVPGAQVAAATGR
jgi:zona occludens toxin